MRIAPYWARESYSGMGADGRQHTFHAWGWSFENVEAARQDAAARAVKIFNRFTQGARLENYLYDAQPLREEIIERIMQDGKEIAVITRNRYGALVLNTAQVMFADIDFPETSSVAKAAKGLFGLFSRSAPAKDMATESLDKVKAWAESHPDHAFRIYRTQAGLRLLFTDKLYDPKAPETEALLKSLDSDRLYIRLTKNQESFRARLTPKPWRCQCGNPPNQFPWLTSAAEQAYRNWEREYADSTSGYTTCTLLDLIGRAPDDPTIKKVIEIHDRYACGDGKLA